MFIFFCANMEPIWSSLEPKGTQRSPNGTQMGAKGAKYGAQDANLEPNGAQMEPTWTPKCPKGYLEASKACFSCVFVMFCYITLHYITCII